MSSVNNPVAIDVKLSFLAGLKTMNAKIESSGWSFGGLLTFSQNIFQNRTYYISIQVSKYCKIGLLCTFFPRLLNFFQFLAILCETVGLLIEIKTLESFTLLCGFLLFFLLLRWVGFRVVHWKGIFSSFVRGTFFGLIVKQTFALLSNIG